MLQLEQSLHDKVGIHELAELREQIHKKLDVTVFVHARTELEDNIRKIDRDVRGIRLYYYNYYLRFVYYYVINLYNLLII